MIRPTVFLLSLLVPSLCYGQACEGKVFAEGSRIGLSGCLSEALVSRAIELMPSDLSEFVVQSQGGDVVAALILARELSKRRANIRIRGFCHSSCANYIIPAGVKAVVEAGSQIAFHGDARITVQFQAATLAANPTIEGAIREILQSEERFDSQNPRASLIHDAQLVVLSNEVVTVRVGLTCKGLGYSRWTPSNSVLLKMGLLDEVVPISNEIMAMIQFKSSEDFSLDGGYAADPIVACAGSADSK